METPEKRKVIRYSGSEILKNPNLLEVGKRIIVLKTIPGSKTKEGKTGVISKFDKETKTLYLSSYNKEEQKWIQNEIKIEEDIEIIFPPF
jgi:hypothetical protein